MIPKTKKKNIRNISVFPSSGNERSMIMTNLLNLGILLTVLNGLITLRALKPLIPDEVSPKEAILRAISSILKSTTKKSNLFHQHLK